MLYFVSYFGCLFNWLLFSQLTPLEPKPELVVVTKTKTTTERTYDTTTPGLQYLPPRSQTTKSRSEADVGSDEDKCKYNCQESGGCSVRILPKSGFVYGKSMGYGQDKYCKF